MTEITKRCTRGQPGIRHNRALLQYLETIVAGLDPDQAVGERFTQRRLAELALKFNLAVADWGRLCGMIYQLKRESEKD